jgi:hypothetical protein
MGFNGKGKTTIIILQYKVFLLYFFYGKRNKIPWFNTKW